MDRESWQAPVHGVTKSWTRLSDKAKRDSEHSRLKGTDTSLRCITLKTVVPLSLLRDAERMAAYLTAMEGLSLLRQPVSSLPLSYL